MSETGADDSGGRRVMLEGLRVAFVLVVWAFWIPYRGLTRGLFWLREYLGSKRWRWITCLVVSGMLIVAGIQVVPLVYSRFALVYEASCLASTSMNRSHEEIRDRLIHEAFRLGYTNVIEQEDAFTIENTYDDDGLPLCAVSIDLRQRVHLIGLINIPFKIRTRITKVVDPAITKPKSLEDRLFGAE
jgi:hypothetical protein